MQIPTDHITLLQNLGTYAFASTTPSELAGKLQTVPGSTVDRLFTSTEMLYAFHEQLGNDGLTVLAQLTGYALANHWDFPGQAGRMQAIYDSSMGALGQTTLAADFQQPAPLVQYREDAKDWREAIAPNLDQTKAAKKQAVNDLRDQKWVLPAPTPFGAVDNDDKSKVKLNGTVTMAMLAAQQSQPFSIDWTMADNSVVTCDGPKICQIGEAAGQYDVNVHARATALKAQIDAAADIAAVDAIDITAGWPA